MIVRNLHTFLDICMTLLLVSCPSPKLPQKLESATIYLDSRFHFAKLFVPGPLLNPPAGQLPALETPQELVDAAAPSGSEFESARAIVEHLRHSRQDLDAGLSPAQKAEAAAFAALVEAKLEPAVLWTTWCESESFSKHTQV